MNALPANFGGKNCAEPVPTDSHRFVTDIIAALVLQIFDLSKRKAEI